MSYYKLENVRNCGMTSVTIIDFCHKGNKNVTKQKPYHKDLHTKLLTQGF